MLITAIIFLCILVYFYIEKRQNDKFLANFHTVIHVNGIRGKTSTCRLIDAALRSQYRVFTKTTGTDARMIHVDGQETAVKRLGPANIHEQLRTIRLAHKEGAQILILECMAVSPQLQATAQDLIVKSLISVITNVRYDHVFEMGDSLTEIAQSLSATVPKDGVLFTSDADFCDFFSEQCKKRNSRLILCRARDGEEENAAIAREVSSHLGISPQHYEASKDQVKQDFGTRCIYPCLNKQGEEIWFYNLFSANDPLSSRKNLEEIAHQYPAVYFVYNHRVDRPDRALLFARYFFPTYAGSSVFLMGSGCALAKRLFGACGLKQLQRVSRWQDCLDLPKGALLVGLGNIKGPGYQMITAMEEENKHHE